MDACDVLVDCGFTKPIAQLTVQDIPQLVNSTALHVTILRVKAEIDQFMDGINDAGTLHAIQKYPGFFRPMFVASQANNVTVGKW